MRAGCGTGAATPRRRADSSRQPRQQTLYLKASEEAFEEISSNILITILTTKLRKDLRQGGFGSSAVVSED